LQVHKVHPVPFATPSGIHIGEDKEFSFFWIDFVTKGKTMKSTFKIQREDDKRRDEVVTRL